MECLFIIVFYYIELLCIVLIPVVLERFIAFLFEVLNGCLQKPSQMTRSIRIFTLDEINWIALK